MTTDLKTLRETSGLTQFELARATGIGRTRISLAECGHIDLMRSEQDAIVRTLRTTIQQRATELIGVLSEASGMAATA